MGRVPLCDWRQGLNLCVEHWRCSDRGAKVDELNSVCIIQIATTLFMCYHLSHDSRKRIPKLIMGDEVTLG